MDPSSDTTISVYSAVMLSTLLSVLLVGAIPVALPALHDTSVIADVSIAPPSEQLHVMTKISASGAVVIDAHSGQEVYGKSPTFRRPMASLTKLMTALIIVENHALTDLVTVPIEATTVVGNKAYLPPGERFTIASLLSALLISSANDAAETLAIHHSGSVEAFVSVMNSRASSLGLKRTAYANPTGLDSSEQFSSPQDIAWLTMHALGHPEIASRLGRRGQYITSVRGKEIYLAHTHALMHREQAITAGKTGTTKDAGECLVSVVEEGSKQYLVVLMRSLQRYDDMRAILASIQPEKPEEVALITSF